MIEALNNALPVIQIVVVPVIGYGTYLLKGIRDEFRRLNGRLGRLEQWKEDHVEETHAVVDRDISRLERAIEDAAA